MGNTKLLVFVYAELVHTIEHVDPLEAYELAKAYIPRFLGSGPVTLFEFNPYTKKWNLLPHAWQDWSHSLVHL